MSSIVKIRPVSINLFQFIRINLAFKQGNGALLSKRESTRQCLALYFLSFILHSKILQLQQKLVIDSYPKLAIMSNFPCITILWN